MRIFKNLYFVFFVLSLVTTNLNAMKHSAEDEHEDGLPARMLELSSVISTPKVKIQKFEIDRIAQILEHIPKNGSTIVVFDYDDVISPSFKTDWCEENEENGTLATIKQLHKMGIKTMVLTARGNGESVDSYFFDLCIEPMCQKLKQAMWFENGALAENEPREGNIKNNKIITINQICFTSKMFGKGEGLEFLIDHKCFKEPPVNIIFIDDAVYNIESVEKAFKNRPENMFLFHYTLWAL